MLPKPKWNRQRVIMTFPQRIKAVKCLAIQNQLLAEPAIHQRRKEIMEHHWENLVLIPSLNCPSEQHGIGTSPVFSILFQKSTALVFLKIPHKTDKHYGLSVTGADASVGTRCLVSPTPFAKVAVEDKLL